MLYICTKLVKTDYIIKVVKIVGSELDENRMDGSSDSVEIKKKTYFGCGDTHQRLWVKDSSVAAYPACAWGEDISVVELDIC